MGACMQATPQCCTLHKGSSSSNATVTPTVSKAQHSTAQTTLLLPAKHHDIAHIEGTAAARAEAALAQTGAAQWRG